jgi:hypothetical protein
MKTLQTLLVGAAVGALLAVAGLAALTAILDPSAADVAKSVSSDRADVPPAFYGTR